MRYGQVVLGPPGSGKSTYCHTLQNYFQITGRECVVVNLDPANDNATYKCDINITELITLEDAMNEFTLGPNGGLLFCMEFLLKNMQWLFDRLKEHPNKYILFDFPGQVELFTANTNITSILQEMENEGYRLAAVNLVDSFYCSNPEVFISAGLTSLISMINLELPAVNILSKIDLIQKYGEVDFDLEYYTQLPAMTRMLYGVDKQHRSEAVLEEEEDMAEMCDEEEFVYRTKDPFQQKYRKLYWVLCDLIDDYGLLSYLPLDVNSTTSVQKIVDTIDKANGFSLYSYVADIRPEQQSQQIMGMFAKSDVGYSDMVDEMNEKYVSKDDDFEGLEDLISPVWNKHTIAQNYVNS